MHVDAIFIRHRLVVNDAAGDRTVRVAGKCVGHAVNLLGCSHVLRHFCRSRASLCQQIIERKQDAVGNCIAQGINQADCHDVHLFAAGNAHGGCCAHVADEQRLDVNGCVDLGKGDGVDRFLYLLQVVVGLVQADDRDGDFVGIFVKIDLSSPGFRCLCAFRRLCCFFLRTFLCRCFSLVSASCEHGRCKYAGQDHADNSLFHSFLLVVSEYSLCWLNPCGLLTLSE